MTTIQTLADLYKMDDYLESRIADLTLLCHRQMLHLQFPGRYVKPNVEISLDIEPLLQGLKRMQSLVDKMI